MSPLDRKLLRDLWHMKGLAFAIAVVIGTGVATFVMSTGVVHSLEETRTAYYERYRFAEVFATLKRAPESLAERISRIPGVKWVQTRIVKQVVLDIPELAEPATGLLISIPERAAPMLNALQVRIGRRVAPGRADEVIISEAFAEAHGFVPGDTFHAVLNGKRRKLSVVGVALSPEYVYSIAPGTFMPDDERFGVMWMGRQALEAAFDLEGAFNDVSLAVQSGASIDEIIARLDDLLEPYGGVGAYDRDDQTSNWFLSGDIDQLRTMATILPTIFLAVSAFLLNMVVSRLVETEREQIGLLKAFGYSNFSVGWHYLKYVLAMVALGIVLGYAGGIWLGRFNTEVYAQFYRFPFLYYRLDPSVFASGALISLAAAAVGTFNAVRRGVTLPPAQAMMPPLPPLYRRGLMRRLGIANAFDQPTLMVLRHIARWPLRSGMTVMGIALALALLISSTHWFDAIDHMLEVDFHQVQRQDLSVHLVEARSSGVMHEFDSLPGVIASEPYRSVPVRFRAAQYHRLESITGVLPEADLNIVLDVSRGPLKVPEEGILLAQKLAELLAVEAGDEVTVEVLEGRRPIQRVRVMDTFETYLGTPAYMNLGSLNRLMLEGPTVSGGHLLVDGTLRDQLYSDLKSTPQVASVTLRTAAIESFNETLAESLNYILFFYVVFACLLAFGVVYNSVRVTLSERGRELASLRVMGFSRYEVSYILLGELAVLTFLAIPLGCAMGFGLSWFMTALFETDLYRIPMVIERSTFGFSIVVISLAALGSGILVRRRIDRLDLIAVLKTRE
jgi:putative ABC transport system permease protein